MKILLLTFGCMGSGKSFWIKQNGLEPYTLSADSIRIQYQGPILTPDGGQAICSKNDTAVWTTLFDLLRKRMARGELTVIDATHSRPAMFTAYKELLAEYGYRIYTVDFSDVPLADCLERNSARDLYKFVPEKVVETCHSRTQNFKPPAFANLASRDKVLEEIRVKPLDWNKYRNVYVTSDIHGCYDSFKEFLDTYQPDMEQDMLILNGDNFDRGTQNGEVLKFWVENFNRKGFLHLDSNHNTHFKKFAFEKESEIKSNEFLYNTKPQLLAAMEKHGYDFGLLRTLARKTAQMAHFTYFGRTWLVNHGGISFIPKEGLAFVASEEFIKGVGRYEDDLLIAKSWNEKMPINFYQIHGHRRINSQDQVGRVFNTEGKVEFGGELKFVQLQGEKIKLFAFKNKNFKPVVVSDPVINTEVSASTVDLIGKIRAGTKREVYEAKFDNISAFCFKKEAFYQNLYKNSPELPRGFFVNQLNDIVAKGMLKIYNWGETENNKVEKLKENLVFPLECFRKENGFAGYLGYDSEKDEIVFCSKSTVGGDYADMFQKIFRDIHNDQMEDIKQYLKSENKCMMFEVIDPINDPHIVEYSSSYVVLLDVYERALGNQKLSYSDMTDVALRFRLPFKIMRRCFTDWENFYSFIHDLESKEVTRESIRHFIEGFVIEDSNGYIFKFKTNEYKFVRYMRTIMDTLIHGRHVNPSKLNTALQNDFVGFMMKKSKEELGKSNIIKIKKEFLALEKK